MLKVEIRWGNYEKDSKYAPAAKKGLSYFMRSTR
jgi:hypothetical protein